MLQDVCGLPPLLTRSPGLRREKLLQGRNGLAAALNQPMLPPKACNETRRITRVAVEVDQELEVVEKGSERRDLDKNCFNLVRAFVYGLEVELRYSYDAVGKLDEGDDAGAESHYLGHRDAG